MMDYHDYVIKDGIFVGKFEEMYQACDNPWNQKDNVIQAHKMACMASLNMIDPRRVLEIGCGLGYLTSFYSSVFPQTEFIGMDISETAIKKAKNAFSNCEFLCGDITQIRDFSTFGGGYDAIILSEILWYILDDLQLIINRLKSTFIGKHILINQSFYDEGEQKYGREYFTNPKEMIDYFGMDCINHVTAYSKGTKGYDVHVLLKVN